MVQGLSRALSGSPASRLHTRAAHSLCGASSLHLPSCFNARSPRAARLARRVRPVAEASPHPHVLMAAAEADQSLAILINGAAGKMGQAVAKAALEAGVPLVPWGITGPGLPAEELAIQYEGGEGAPFILRIVPAEERDVALDQALEQWPGLVIVDYTLPAAVNGNAEWYCARRVPFVMGTTGGDREKLLMDVEAAGVNAVIAAQMGKQVVAFISAMELLAQESPGAFAGYTLKVVESHQSTKVDTSGTAKDVVAAFQRLGVKFSVDEIEKVREPEEQRSRMGVPEEHLNGHAFHTYTLTSPDNTVSFQFQHNVCGRSIYAQGAVDAVLFLHRQIADKAPKTLYNMIDVLKAGSMR